MLRASTALTALLALGALAGGAAAQAKPAAKPKLKPATGTTTLAVSPALAWLQFGAKELPAGVTRADGVKCVSVQAQGWYDDPGFAASVVPAPVGKVGQSFRRGKSSIGSLMAFEFEDVVSADTLGFVQGLIWGPGGRSAEHPEEILATGAFLVVTSFPEGEESAAWFKSQIELRLAHYKPRDWSKVQSLLADAASAVKHDDPEGGIMMLRKKAELIEDCAYAQLLLGQLAGATSDWSTAETAYDRALGLHDNGTDRLPDGRATLWTCVNGLALVMLQRESTERALPYLQRGAALARAMGDDARLAASLYDLARGLARLQKWDDCLKALAESIQLAPERKATAAQEADLATARQRPEFKKLLGP